MKCKFSISEVVTYEIEVETSPLTSESGRRALALQQLALTPALDRLNLVVGTESHSVQEMYVPFWSQDQEEAAARQGWVITSHDDGSYHIESRDDARQRVYKTDAAANHWVRYQAEEGSVLHVAAVAYVNSMNKGA